MSSSVHIDNKEKYILIPCESNRFLFVNAKKTYQFKAKDSEEKNYALCLGYISKNFTINNMKKQD